MSLLNTITELSGKAQASKNRVEILLDKLDGSDDGDTLATVLRTPSVTSATITKALRKEYGTDSVTDSSVDAWRRKNNAEVNGL